MEYKTEAMLIAFIGLVMAFIAGYTQWISTDLTRFSISYYVENSVSQWPWWSTVGLPFLAGIAYLIAGVFWAGKRGASRKSSLTFFGVCLFLAIALLLLDGIGFFAAIFTLLVFLSCATRSEK